MNYVERTLTRDAPLVAIQGWYEGATAPYDTFFGFALFPEHVFIHRNGAFEFWRDNDRLYAVLAGNISKVMKEDKKRLQNTHNQLIDSLNFLREAQSKDYKNIEEMLKALEEAIKFFALGFVGVFVVHWIPIMNENLRKEGKNLFDEEDIKKIIEWREKEGNVFYNEGVNAFYSILKKIAENKKWGKNLLNCLTFSEIAETVKNNKPLPMETIEKRKNSVFAYFKNKVVFEPQLEAELEKIGYQMKKEASEGIKQIEGSIASKGYAKGKVRKIFSREQINNIKKGDILVAPMTSVWYVPAIEKASAIVTDEGGITCHAAIISREMKIPCIVGTKIATKVLKDGDLIEVDAEQGIVRKIE